MRHKTRFMMAASLAAAMIVPAPTPARAPASSASETRHDALIDMMNRYIDAMVVLRDPASLPLDPAVRATENGQPVAIGEGLWKSVRAISYRLMFADAQSGQVGLYATGQEEGGPVIFSVRLKVRDGRITESEIVSARKGEASLFAPDAMDRPDPIYTQIVPPAQRTPRASMIAAAQAYYDGIEQSEGSKVPAAPGCYRVENGVDTHKVPSLQLAGHCNAGLHLFGWINPVRARRFPIVDEERGLVWALVIMEIKGGTYISTINGKPEQRVNEPRAILVGELFKIVGGRTRRMEVVMRDVPYGASSGW